MQNKYADDKDFLLVALSDEPVETVKPFAKKNKINYIVGMDAKSTFKDFGIRGYPTIFVLDRAGEIVYKGHSAEEAEDAIDEAKKAKPEKPVAIEPLGSGAAKTALAKADDLFKKKEYAKALKEYEKLAKVYKDTDVGKKAKAQVAKIKGDKAMMASVAEGEAKAKCEDWLQTARMLAKSGKSEDAAKYYKKVIEQFPNSTYAQTAQAELAGL
ncbi:MAG: redoxin domain-containing protein [Planctomycetes bacterium]|nr:redoxin domain-containing protein [Planctomycetota bacterium]